MNLDYLVANIGAFTDDAVLITEAEPISEPGPRILWCNDAFVRMTGYGRQDVIGRNPRLLQGEKTSAAARAAIRAGLSRWRSVNVDICNYTKTGEEFWVNLSLHPVPDETGWIHFWVAIQRNISAARAMLDEVARQRDELVEANKAIRAFAAVASHDLREPLRKIAIFADLLGEQLEAGQVSAAFASLAMIKASAKRGTQMVTDVLRLSSATTVALEWDQFDGKAAVEEVLQDFRLAIDDAGVEVTCRMEMAPLYGDRSAFVQIVRNIVGNAIKHRSRARTPHLDIVGRDEGGRQVLSFEDNGLGIPESIRFDVFRPFVARTAPDDRSSGLGLTIVKALTDKLEWSIDFDSSDGEGTIFTLGIPYASAARGRVASEQPAA